MARRSNSTNLPGSPQANLTRLEELPSPMKELSSPIEELPSPMVQAGHAADAAAARHIFTDYQQRLAPNTRRQQAATLELWAHYLGEAGLQPPDVETLRTDPAPWREITWGLVAGFRQWMINAGYAVGSVNVRLGTIRAYCKLAHQVGVLDPVQYSRICLIKGYGAKEAYNLDHQREVTRLGEKKADWVTLTVAQAARLKAQPRDTPQGRRDALLMCLLLDHGLRVGEVAALKGEHFDLDRRTFTFYREKVKKTQTHLLTPDSYAAARPYIMKDVGAQGPLLRGSRKDETLFDSAMTTRSITRRVLVLGEEIGIEGLSAHDCRHYWATAASMAGTPIKDLQDAGGWSSPVMPLHYARSAEIANQRVRLPSLPTSEADS